MSGYSSSSTFDFVGLESTYKAFIAPAFEIEIGSFTIDSVKIPVSGLTIQLSTENKAGTCTFTVEALYDYENSKWAEDFFNKVDAGMTVKVKAGYATQTTRVFYGFVQQVSVEYSSECAPRLNVTAMDGLALLMNNREEQDFGSKTTKDIVTELFNACKSAGVVESLEVDTLPTFEGKFVKDKKSSDYDFLCRLAEMCGMSFCVIDGQLLFKNFKKNATPLSELQMGLSLISFSRTLSIGSDITGSVTVISTGTKDKKEVRGVADKPSAYDEGKLAEEKWAALGGTNRDFHLDFLQTAEECKTVAQNLLDTMCLGFVQGQGRCVGIPEIIPGRFIKVKGMDDKTNGKYYITEVTHTFTEGGFFTDFVVKGTRSK